MTWFYLLFFHCLVKNRDPTLLFICTKSSSTVYASTYKLYLFLKILILLAGFQTISWRQASAWGWTQHFGDVARTKCVGEAVSRRGTLPFGRSHKLHISDGPWVTPVSPLAHCSVSNGGKRRCCLGRTCETGCYVQSFPLVRNVHNSWIRDTRGYVPASSF